MCLCWFIHASRSPSLLPKQSHMYVLGAAGLQLQNVIICLFRLCSCKRQRWSEPIVHTYKYWSMINPITKLDLNDFPCCWCCFLLYLSIWSTRSHFHVYNVPGELNTNSTRSHILITAHHIYLFIPKFFILQNGNLKFIVINTLYTNFIY